MNERMIDKLVQKIIGIFMIVIPIIMLKFGLFYEPTINSNDGTFLLLTVPIGLYMMFTKHNYIYENKIES